MDLALGAWGPELQHVGDAGGLPGAGGDGDAEVRLVLKSLVQQVTLRGHAVPDYRQDLQFWSWLNALLRALIFALVNCKTIRCGLFRALVCMLDVKGQVCVNQKYILLSSTPFL